MDIADTLTPVSDQLDAVDLSASGPRTFTIKKVSKNNGDQPLNIELVEFPRVWRPGKSMRRVLAACWTTDASTWTGRRVRLFCDDTVTFGRDAVGGTRISHLSHIDGPKKIPLLVTRGKSQMFTVQPLPDETPEDKVKALRAEWKSADPERRAQIEKEVARLSGGDTEPPSDTTAEPTDDDIAALNEEARQQEADRDNGLFGGE